LLFYLFVFISSRIKLYVFNDIFFFVSRKRDYFTICVGRALMVIQVTCARGTELPPLPFFFNILFTYYFQ